MSAKSSRTLHAGVIIAAGGIGKRLGASGPKQFLYLAGVPILARTCSAFLEHPAIGAVVVVVPPDHDHASRDLLRQCLPAFQFRRIVFTPGGALRQDSVRNGLTVMDGAMDLILVHDGARPLVDRTLIQRCIDGARLHGAAIAAVEVKDTLKQVKDGVISATIERTERWLAQTPQAARRDLLEQAYAQAAADGFIGTDEASLLERAGIPVHVVQGSERNLKITRPDDLELARRLAGDMENMKIGHGFDAHQLVEGRPLILGGVEIPYERGLAGHSDADVVTHALTDALLGALGAGDLGRHFPDTDERFRGIDSLLLLADVITMAMEQGLSLGNADITVICQRPKLAPHIPLMQERLARTCRVAAERINIKATTTEQMGYLGRGEGIAAHAVVLMRSSHAD